MRLFTEFICDTDGYICDDLRRSLKDVDELQYINKIKMNNSNSDEIDESDFFFSSNPYDLAKGRRPLENLVIKIDSSKISRYSCAAHKLNLA